MGTLVLHNIEKSKYTFEIWTSTSDYADPEEGLAHINVTKDKEQYGLFICLADYNDRWIQKFIQCFIENLEFRTKFLIKDMNNHIPHAYETIELNGEFIDIEIPLVPAIKALNSYGAKTSFCCKGDVDSTPYIALEDGNFPDELKQAWTGAGYMLQYWSVHANAPVGLSASSLFIQSLTDWLSGNLDVTGERYRIKEKRPSSLPVLPKLAVGSKSQANEKVAEFLSKKTKHLTFKDYAALKSGRDVFSSMSFTNLVENSLPVNIAKVKMFPDTALQGSGLRWVLRGLPIDMAIRKVQVDQEIAANIKR